MISRYEYRKRGVWDRDRGMLVLPSDTEWSHYVAYVREGGQVDAMPPPEAEVLPPEELAARAEIEARRIMREELRIDTTIDFLRTHTPAETAAWVNANVTDLASAKAVLVKLAMIVAYLARERLSRGD